MVARIQTNPNRPELPGQNRWTQDEALGALEVVTNGLQRLSPNSVKITGCNAGQGSEGFELCKKVAAALKCPVDATTGRCHNIEGEPRVTGGRWPWAIRS
jgi:hypothetical protein